MKISATHEYVGEEKLENLARTIVKHHDGTETIITYRKTIGGEYVLPNNNKNMDEVEPTTIVAEAAPEPIVEEVAPAVEEAVEVAPEAEVAEVTPVEAE